MAGGRYLAAVFVLPKWLVAFIAVKVCPIAGHTLHTPQNNKSRHKKPAPEYPTARAGIGVLFRISFVVQVLAVFRTTHNPEDDMSSGGYAVFQF